MGQVDLGVLGAAGGSFDFPLSSAPASLWQMASGGKSAIETVDDSLAGSAARNMRTW
jgi:hypothetical protein